MMRQPSRRMTILTSQLSIVFISFVSAFIPQYYMYVFLIYFVVLMFIMFRTTKAWSKIPPQRELGSPLFKEGNALKIAMFDKLLMNELKKQAMASMSLLLLTLVVIFIFPLYRGLIFPLTVAVLSSMIDSEIIVIFLAFLIMYEFIFGILTLLRIMIMSRIRASNIMLPQNYIVYKKGIVLNDKFFIEFSNKYCFEYDGKRRYVEIRDRGRGSTRIRLYTDATSELKDKIRELGVLECSSIGTRDGGKHGET